MTGRGGRWYSRRGPASSDGYAMVALLVALSIMAVMLSVALPTWRTMAQRERESELIFRGEQYARAIALFQRKYANAFPPSIDVLVEQRFLRKKYLDPVTGDDFQLLFVGQAAPGQAAPGQAGRVGGAGLGAVAGGAAGTAPVGIGAQPVGGRAGIMGVSSKSEASSLREYNGRTKYNEWTFVATQATTSAGAPNGSQTPTGGGTGRGGGPQGPGLGGGARDGAGRGLDGGRRGGGANGAPRGGGGAAQPFGGGSFGRGL